MARTDSTRHLSEAKLSELVGVSQQYRQSLVRRKLIEPRRRGGCTRTDAVELAAIEFLSHHLAPSELVVAWRQLGPQLRQTLPRGRLDVVFDRELGTVAVVRSDAELRASVISGRAIVVIELGPRLQEILDAFGRWASVTGAAAERRSSGLRKSRPA